jgi:thiol:disulfide interchange protein DsbD
MRVLASLLLLLVGLAAARPSAALESAAVRSPRTVATLIADRTAVAPGESVRIGLRLLLSPGWHTYWRNPGDAGAAPELLLTLPEGAAAGPMAWPAPERIAFGPLVSFGYTEEVVLAMPVTAPPAAEPGDILHLEASASWLVCQDICVPEEGRFALDLPVASSGPPSADLAPIFAMAGAAEPRPSPWPAQAAIAGGALRLVLSGPEFSPGTLRKADFFPDEAVGPLIDHAAPQPLTVANGALRIDLKAAGRVDAPMPAVLTGVLVLTDMAGRRDAFGIEAPLSASPLAVSPLADAPPSGRLALWQALLWGLLGGLILNLMPCVFPVLAMKATALARLSGTARSTVRAHAASYTAGVLSTFLLLGGALISLRGAGFALGWGFQFTAPAAVAVLCWLMLAVGLNLSGVFAMGRPLGAGGGLAARGGHAGSFATGALAVVVASPCTAPFMAAAVGTALALPAPAALAVFAALGLGLAAPYAVLGIAPGLARALPRPGPWMERLRQVLAFPMYATAAWLAWVLAQQAGPAGLALALAGAVLVGFAAWAFGVAQRGGGARGPAVGRGLALGAALGALALLPGLQRPAEPRAAASPNGIETWSARRVAALQAEGRAVFVNLTAAWCITCQVNERLVLRSEAVQAAFTAHGVTMLKGDWTNGDPAIGDLLRAHGREGVPLYLLYPPGPGPAVLLPEVLTEGTVLRALGRTMALEDGEPRRL